MTDPTVIEEHSAAAAPPRPETSTASDAVTEFAGHELVFDLDDVNCYYGDFRAVRNVDMEVAKHEITAMIGPSGCGKSTLLRSLNRMNDLIPGAHIEGEVRYHGENIYDPDIDPVEVRRRIGMVFQKPNPFPKSIFDNVAYGPRLLGTKYKDDFDNLVGELAEKATLSEEAEETLRISAEKLFDQHRLLAFSGRGKLVELIDSSLEDVTLDAEEKARFKDEALALFNGRKFGRGVRKRDLQDTVEEALTGAALWDEVKDRLNAPGLGLSGGQQQRLCIARAIAVKPEVLLMDEPCSALDPIATARIEDLMQEIKDEFTIVIVTHNMQQAARVSDRTAFFTTEVNEESDHRTGVLVEYDATEKIFSNPDDERTENYITGRFG